MSTVNQKKVCPSDNTELISTVKNGIEIEYCPTCGGVWLDHGELEKLIALASQPKFGPPALEPTQSAQQQYPQEHSYNNKSQYKKKKENWLGEIFDF